MPKLSHHEMEEFLAKPLICRLGCLDDEGFPYVVPCIYLYDSGSFYVPPRATSAWGRYLDRDPRVSLCIDASNYEEEQYNKRVLVKGRAECLIAARAWRMPGDGDPLYEGLFRIARRYRSNDEELVRDFEMHADVGSWLFRVDPIEVTTWWGDYAKRYRNVYSAP